MSQTAIALVGRLNKAWQTHDFEAVTDCFDPQAILLPPDLGAPIQGRAAIVDTYRTFAEVGELIRFDEIELTAHEYGTTQIVHLEFEIEYRLADQQRIDQGFEFYVIASDGPARIVWRQQVITSSRDLI